MVGYLDEEGDMNIHDRGVLYYRLLKSNVKEAQRIVCGQIKNVTEENTVISRVRENERFYEQQEWCSFGWMSFTNQIIYTSHVLGQHKW